MEFNDFLLGSLWGIPPETLNQYSHIALFDDHSVKTAMQGFTASTESFDEISMAGSVAIIPIHGPLSKRQTIYSSLFGGSSLVAFETKFEQAMNNNSVKAIMLDIDSPGGPVDSVSSVSDMVRQGREKKPVVAFANGQMLGTAYWIGSAASAVITERTASLGSIGVVTIHYDLSAADEKQGLKRSIISAGKFKAVGNSAVPLSDSDRKVLQNLLDHLYSIFTSDVAKNRKVSERTVTASMADGQVFIGESAVTAGLADGIGNLNDAMATANELIGKAPGYSPKSSSHIKSEFSQRRKQVKTFMELVDDHIANQLRIGKTCTRTHAMREVARKHPEVHKAYLENENSGESRTK